MANSRTGAGKAEAELGHPIKLESKEELKNDGHTSK